MSQHLYSQAGAAGGPDGADRGGTAPQGEDVQDAEFEVKK
jgi:hypothetical protein